MFLLYRCVFYVTLCYFQFTRYPKNTSRHLEAAILCGLKEINISLSGTSYVIDTEGENMEIEGEEGTKYKMRRVELEDGMNIS